jgi:hypothetical protein
VVIDRDWDGASQSEWENISWHGTSFYQRSLSKACRQPLFGGTALTRFETACYRFAAPDSEGANTGMSRE